eukprot:m.168973 g.168973  ORF g.168973 m.168973 type:complete len:119 (+) comp13032_c0_seq1:2137-2493(+)
MPVPSMRRNNNLLGTVAKHLNSPHTVAKRLHRKLTAMEPSNLTHLKVGRHLTPSSSRMGANNNRMCSTVHRRGDRPRPMSLQPINQKPSEPTYPTSFVTCNTAGMPHVLCMMMNVAGV